MVAEAVFDIGFLKIVINNELDLDSELKMIIPNIQDASDNTDTLIITLPRSTLVDTVSDLTETLTFITDMTAGNLLAPVEFTIGESDFVEWYENGEGGWTNINESTIAPYNYSSYQFTGTATSIILENGVGIGDEGDFNKSKIFTIFAKHIDLHS